jgi:hypothetical protein
MIRKTTRKTTRKTNKKLIYKVIATYNARFGSAADARASRMKTKQNPKAIVSSLKKFSGGSYGFTVKFTFVTPSSDTKNQAVTSAKKVGAKVTVSTVRV